MIRFFKYGLLITFLGIAILSCVKDRNFERPENLCATDLVANTTYAEIKNLYVDETIQIQEDFDN